MTKKGLGQAKVSVYISLVMIGAIAIADLITNQSIAASATILIGLLAFAGGRQLLKSGLGK